MAPGCREELEGRQRWTDRPEPVRAYQHAARFHVPTLDYAEAVLAEGSQIRTVAEIPGQMIVIDRRTAFLPHIHHEFGAIVVREPSVLAYLCAAFEQSWNLGSPFQAGVIAAGLGLLEAKGTGGAPAPR